MLLKSGFERVRQLTIDVEKVLASFEKELAPVSGQKTEKEECEELRQRMKDGLLKKPTVR
ncbi:hypothetical protein COLO4_37692 [Corchorus olitorius]|uniref:Uncharacterized protein n=1 Tax=Corchorus olitorius TaxID=93759 RepID=A0A1R3G013_9ROSI|nr:hypothetical protein COLO4_37692 [Corchorus olitorius]